MAEPAKPKKAKRSLQACPHGIERARNVLTGKGLSQAQLEEAVGLSHATVTNFFTRKSVDRPNFVKICDFLDLGWLEISGQANSTDLVSSSDSVSTDIDALVQQVREKIKPLIEERCGTMRVLDMTQPIGLNDIYTNVNILEKITGRTWRELAELRQNFDLNEFDRFGLGKITEKRVSGLKAVQQHSKLMVLGKPGAGKTTFLKYLAMQCIEGQFQCERFPMFITLKDFAEAPKQPSIQEYIAQHLSRCKVTDANVVEEDLLEQGKVLVLLDGLDEVREDDNSRVIRQIKDFTEQYSKNQIVVTCRIAANEYVFQRFVEVEIADFNDQQIASFANKWFQKRKPGQEEKFVDKLKENEPIKELANNPLILTLLCLIFEEKGKFKNNRSELYEEGIELLLEKWDNSREIEREEIYINLSTRRQEDLFSKIALETFESGNYFFKYTEAERLISEYIHNLPDAETSEKVLLVNSRKILKSVEAQHGLLVERAKRIYSFSHLTFHEYFTAREIKERSAWARLAEHVTQKRWREVFLLTFGMVRSADDLLKLMKQKVDELLAKDKKLQKFLTWVKEKSDSVEVPYKPAAVRAFYHDLARIPTRTRYNCSFSALDRSRRRAFGFALDPIPASPQALGLALTSIPTNVYDLTLDQILTNILTKALIKHQDIDITLDNALNLVHASKLKQSLQNLKDQLLNPKDNHVIYNSLRSDNKAQNWIWIEQLKHVMIEHRDIGHDWHFSAEEEKLLQQYYDANKLLVDCLNSDCYVSRKVRQEIEDTLLLPAPNNQ